MQSSFPWDDSPNVDYLPWMPLAPNYRYANAKTELANDFSHAEMVKIAAGMRKSPAVRFQADVFSSNSPKIFVFKTFNRTATVRDRLVSHFPSGARLIRFFSKTTGGL